MKKLVSISLFVFWAAVVAILIAGLITYQNRRAAVPAPGSLLAADTGEIILDAAEISRHNSSDSCWMVINNKVYNLTGYLGIHPGEAETILPYCGKEGTAGFGTKDKRKPQAHSSYADSLLSAYFIGDLNQAINQSVMRQNIQNIGNVSLPPKESKDDDDD